MTKPSTASRDTLPVAWYPGRSQADVHHQFSRDQVAFQMGEVSGDNYKVRTVGRPVSNLLYLLDITPKNQDSFIVSLPEGPAIKVIPCDQCSTIYGWDRIFKHWRLLETL